MASVKMKANSAGPAGNRAAGSVYPVTPEEGAELVAGGFAEWVDRPQPRQIERAVVVAPETATAPAQRPHRRGR